MNELNNELISNFIEEFQDEETRHIYTEEFLNGKIATQIKALREQRGWTQSELAEKAGMKQERISALEDVNYSAWTLNVLRRLAKAFDLRIDLNFADFGSFLSEFTNFNRKSLERKSFKDDLAFKLKESKNSIKEVTKPNKPLDKLKEQILMNYSEAKNTNQTLKVIKPTRTGVVINPAPELPFSNMELVWSQPNNTSVKKKGSHTLAKENKHTDTTAERFLNAGGYR